MNRRREKELTGRHVLIMILAFFGVMLAVNIYFTIVAVKSFRGEDVPRSYRQGLEYNQTLDARSQQRERGWTAHVNVVPQGDTSRIAINIQDKNGNPVPNLNLEAKLRHPTDTALDQPVIFRWEGKGRYAADTNLNLGRWHLLASARNDTELFSFEYEIWLS